MTQVDKRRTVEPLAPRRVAAAASGTRRAWTFVAALGLVVVVTGSVWVAQTGLSGSSRGNPAGRVARQSPLFGVTNWPAVLSLIFVGVSLVMLLVFAWLSIRQRRTDHRLIVFVCALGLSLLDPVNNWVNFTVFDPRFLHFPTSWHWMSLAPLVEPLVMVPGYPMYLLTVALLASVGAKRLLASARPGGWAATHPRLTYCGVGFAAGVIWDVPAELFMIRAHAYIYSEAWGPTIGTSHGRLPFLISLFTGFAVAVITVLLHRDDRGRSLAHDWAEKLPGRGGASTLRTMAAGTFFLWLTFVIPVGFFAGIRVAGLTYPNVPSGWVYPESKVYDPYGHLRDAGVPGPYFR